MNHPVYQIVAVDEKNGIGKDNKMPWHFPKDMKHFQSTTEFTTDPELRNMVIMGRTTWESIPENHRPLKDRLNIVLTRNPDYKASGAIVCGSLEEAYELADESIETIFIIGGASIFKSSIKNEEVRGLYITKIHKTYECDTFYPEIPKVYGKETLLGRESEKDVKLDFLLYER